MQSPVFFSQNEQLIGQTVHEECSIEAVEEFGI